jgi:arylsulfatase A-like enzyme
LPAGARVGSNRLCWATITYGVATGVPVHAARSEAAISGRVPPRCTVAARCEEVRRRDAIDAYDASLAYLDAELRRLFDDLARRGLDKNLLVVITSDHGESLGEHNLFDHRNSLYLEQIRIPLIMRLPGKLDGGRRVRTAVGLNQLAAPMMQFSGAPAGQFPTDARPIWQEAHTSHNVIAELAGGQFPGVFPHWPIWHGSIRCAINSRWHFIVNEKGEKELYDWPADPGETRNLAATPELQEIIASMSAQVDFPKRTARHATQEDPLRKPHSQ